MKERIIKRLSQTLLPDLQQYITAAFYKTPQDFEINYLSQMGSGFSIAPIFRQSAWFRYHNKDPKITNLYHVGAGTHPGAGMPGVLSSAKVLDKLLEEAT
jgi:phytoene desaturase